MEITQTPVRMHMTGRMAVKRGPVKLAADAKIEHSDLQNLGVDFRAMDSALVGGGSGGVPGYLGREALETWLPGTLRAITQVRNIDEIAGVTTVGRWEDERIKLRMATPAGNAEIYGDNANIPLADVRTTIEERGIVRFEQGFMTGNLETARMSAAGFDAANEKRRAVQETLDIARNDVGFRGYASTSTKIYGLLNDPNLPAYMAYGDVGGGGVVWKSATFANLVTDFTRMINAIEAQSGGHLQDGASLCFVVPTGYREVFQRRETNTGVSFRAWLAETYPNLRVVTSPDLVGANGSNADAAYLFVENAGDYDDSDVSGAAVVQAVPVRYQVIGSENRIKGYVEDAVNATAGCFVLRPWAFARYTISA